MISIDSKSNKLVVSIDTSIGYTIELTYGRTSDMDAILLANQIRKDLDNRIEKIRRDAYNLGWSDKSGKKNHKRKNFSGLIREPQIGNEFIGY